MTYTKLNHEYEWHGGDCPVMGDAVVEVKLRNSIKGMGVASSFVWEKYQPDRVARFTILSLPDYMVMHETRIDPNDGTTSYIAHRFPRRDPLSVTEMRWIYPPIEPNQRKETMEDTDWRPSTCPDCGETREAARDPVCTNPSCSYDAAAIRLNDEPKVGLYAPTSGRKVTSYLDRSGVAHASLHGAILADLAKLLGDVGMAERIVDKHRIEVMKLLNELG